MVQSPTATNPAAEESWNPNPSFCESQKEHSHQKKTRSQTKQNEREKVEGTEGRREQSGVKRGQGRLPPASAVSQEKPSSNQKGK